MSTKKKGLKKDNSKHKHVNLSKRKVENKPKPIIINEKTTKINKENKQFNFQKIIKVMRAALNSDTSEDPKDKKEILTNPQIDVNPIIKNRKMPETGNIFNKTLIPGLDSLLVEGIPKGAAVIVCGGTGSGKTILNLQIMANACMQGKKCLYLTLEESELRLISHMNDFGWDAKRYIREEKLAFLRLNPFDIMRSVDSLLAKEKGELLIDIKPVILPKDYTPEFIFVDSLTAISAAFIGRKDTYRVYIEKLFRYFEEIGATTFLITETAQIPKQFSPTGTEEFLADGVIILYSIQRQNIRERAIEVLKMRGVAHQRKVVAMRIVKGVGVEIFPDQEVFVKEI